jgi:hypothetical protein
MIATIEPTTIATAIDEKEAKKAAAAAKRAERAAKKAELLAELKKEQAATKAEEKKKKGKGKAVKTSSRTSSLLIAAAVTLGLGKVFGTNPDRPSCVIRMKPWAEFQAELNASEGDTEEKSQAAKMFFILREMTERLVPSGPSTFVVHTSGSFALYARFSDAK